MFSVLFEVHPKSDQWDTYLGYAKMLRPELEQIEGFVDNIRYRSLTREGERFYADACKILMSLDEAEAALAGDNAAATGLLRVYVLPSFARWQLAPLMPEFLAKYPSLSVELQLGNEPLRSLDSNIDIVIQGGRLRDSSLGRRRHRCAGGAFQKRHRRVRSGRRESGEKP